MGRRPSISSDVSSTLSEATTLQPRSSKDDGSDGSGGGKIEGLEQKQKQKQQAPRRGLRQKARDVLSDLGSPPTARHDAKEGKPVKNYADLGLLGSAVTARPAHV